MDGIKQRGKIDIKKRKRERKRERVCKKRSLRQLTLGGLSGVSQAIVMTSLHVRH